MASGAYWTNTPGTQPTTGSAITVATELKVDWLTAMAETEAIADVGFKRPRMNVDLPWFALESLVSP